MTCSNGSGEKQNDAYDGNATEYQLNDWAVFDDVPIETKDY